MLGRILILFALVVTAAVMLFYVMFSGSAESVQAPGVMVRVAAADLRPGGFLDEGDAPMERRPEWPRMDEYVTEAGPDVLGAVIIAPIRAGQPVPRAALLAPGQEGFLAAALTPGMRAVSIGVDEISGNAGHIFPGDRIDLLLTQQIERGGARDWVTETILRDARVIAVDQKINENPADRSVNNVARTMTLEVAPRDAERVALARNLGVLSLTLRSFLTEAPRGRGEENGDGPVWAGDISSARRAEPSETPEAPAAAPVAEPAAAPPPQTPVIPDAPRRVAVLRGPASSVFTQEDPTITAPAAPSYPGLGYPGAMTPGALFSPPGAPGLSPPLLENPR